MSSWNDGYVTDIAYTYGFYHELNPLRVKFALLNAGYKAPDFDNGEEFNALELGFGQGN